jgi:hypothetical protein
MSSQTPIEKLRTTIITSIPPIAIYSPAKDHATAPATLAPLFSQPYLVLITSAGNNDSVQVSNLSATPANGDFILIGNANPADGNNHITIKNAANATVSHLLPGEMCRLTYSSSLAQWLKLPIVGSFVLP